MLIQRKQPCLTLYESALFRTVTTLLEGDDFMLLVDPNWLPQEVEFIAEEVRRRSRGRKLYLLFTHSDYDHIIGYRRFPGAETIASAAFTENPDEEKILTQIREFDDAYYLRRSYSIEYPTIRHAMAGQGSVLPLGAETAHFYQAPGHNRDGILTFLPERGVLIVGDYLSNIEFPYLYHSVADYRATLDRLEQLIGSGGVRLLITGHGDATDDRKEMERRLLDSREYLDALEGSLREDTPFAAESLFQRYGFPKVMADFHAGNVKLMQQHINLHP